MSLRGVPPGVQQLAARIDSMLQRIAALERASSSGAASSAVPLGTIIDYYGTGPPSADYLECDGSVFDPLTYPDLNTHLGGSTLPDLRDRSTVGAGNKFTNGQTAGSADAVLVEHDHDFTTDNDTHNHSTPNHNHSAQLQHVGWSGRTSTGGGGSTSVIAQENTGGAVQWSSTGIRQNGNSGGGVTGNNTHNHDGTTDPAGSGDGTDANYHPVYAVRKCIKAVP